MAFKARLSPEQPWRTSIPALALTVFSLLCASCVAGPGQLGASLEGPNQHQGRTYGTLHAINGRRGLQTPPLLVYGPGSIWLASHTSPFTPSQRLVQALDRPDIINGSLVSYCIPPSASSSSSGSFKAATASCVLCSTVPATWPCQVGQTDAGAMTMVVHDHPVRSFQCYLVAFIHFGVMVTTLTAHAIRGYPQSVRYPARHAQGMPKAISFHVSML